MCPSEKDDNCPISRRHFHRDVAVTTAAGLAVAGLPTAARSEPAAQKTKLPAGKYIDVHTHLEQKWFHRGELTADMMLQWMDEHDVARVVVLALVSPEAWHYPISSHWVLEATKDHHDRLIPFCDVDPRTVYLKGVKGFKQMLQRYVDAGAKGLGEHKCAGPINDPRRMDLFRAAAELGLPILFHMDGLRNTDKPGLPGLEQVLKEIPNTVFLGHAPGWWNAIKDGTIDRLMDKYPNIYGDLSAGSGYHAISRDPAFGRQFVLRRADRLCFGTDYLSKGQKIPQFAFYDKLDLPEEVQAKVFRDNARRILGLP